MTFDIFNPFRRRSTWYVSAEICLLFDWWV